METKMQQNLTEALAVLNIRHEPSSVPGKRDWFAANGDRLGTFDAHEGWEKLKDLTARVEQERA